MSPSVLLPSGVIAREGDDAPTPVVTDSENAIAANAMANTPTNTATNTAASAATNVAAAAGGPVLRELTCSFRTKLDLDGRPVPLGSSLISGADAAPFFTHLLGHEPVEVFAILCLNTKYQIVGWHEVSRGTIDRTYAEPRDIFRPALMMGAAYVIGAHNHPSGDPTPSPADVTLTRRLIATGQLLGVPMLDHLIIGGDTFVSIRPLVKRAAHVRRVDLAAERFALVSNWRRYAPAEEFCRLKRLVTWRMPRCPAAATAH